MAFTGELESLPIVDVIQLMNSTRKTGVLTVKGRKGESQLVFKDGYIVSASHLNNSVRIGELLVNMELISPEQLEQGLQKQRLDGADRRPLAITLIELGILSENDAYKGLQHLIEMTVVEILSWKSGKFSLDYLTDVVDSDFKYYPDRMSHEINVNTQSILMDALRIFDEKMRDGLIEDEPDLPAVVESPADETISVDDLGLSDLDCLTAPIRPAFSAAAPFDPVSFQREKLLTLAPELSATASEKIAGFLAKQTLHPEAETKLMDLPKLIIAGSDNLFVHAMETVTSFKGVCLTTAVSVKEVESVIESAMLKDSRVRVVFDVPSSSDPRQIESMTVVRNRLCSRHPALVCIQLVAAQGLLFSLEAYRSGVRAVLPKPSLAAGIESFADEFIALVEFLPTYLL